MSYLRGLDEYSERELVVELDSRSEARTQGVCDYCGRVPQTSVCRFKDRHRDERIVKLHPEDFNALGASKRRTTISGELKVLSYIRTVGSKHWKLGVLGAEKAQAGDLPLPVEGGEDKVSVPTEEENNV